MSEQSDWGEDNRKHLDFVQSAITRMSSSSAAVKSWGLTIVGATYGFAASQDEPSVAFLGLVLVGFLVMLDTRYLREEKLFRKLFEAARKMEVEVYSMNKSLYTGDKDCRLGSVVASWSVAGFWGPLALVGVFWAVIAGW